MKRTPHQTTRRTLTDLERARQRHTPVTLAATVHHRDEHGHHVLVETLRTIEIHAIHTTAAGHLVVVGLARLSGDYVSFRLDRITAYQVHRRMRFVHDVPPPEWPEPATVAEVIAAELGRDASDYADDDYNCPAWVVTLTA